MAAHYDRDPSVGSQQIYSDQISSLIFWGKQCNDVLGIKDKESKFIYLNHWFESYFGVFDLNQALISTNSETYNLAFRTNTLHHQACQDVSIPTRNSYLLTIKNDIDGYHYPYLLDELYFIGARNEKVASVLLCRKAYLANLNENIQESAHSKICFDIPSDIFTKREWDIVFLLLQRIPPNLISNKLNLSIKTVRNYLQRIYRKAGVNGIDDFRQYCFINNFELYYPRHYLKDSVVLL